MISYIYNQLCLTKMTRICIVSKLQWFVNILYNTVGVRYLSFLSRDSADEILSVSTNNKHYLMFIGPCIILLVELIEPTWCYFMKVFCCSKCFECYYIHPQEQVTVCRCIVLFRCVLVYWCGSAGVGWYPNAGWSTYVLQPAPEDECNNIRNMLSNKKLS